MEDRRNPQALISVKDCSKSFNGIIVFDKVSFELMPGEVHCLCGENGAGKSTFIKILSGAYVPDGGEVYICGTKITTFDPGVSRSLGLQTIYQNEFLMHNLSIAENIYMGDYGTDKPFLNYKQMQKKTKAYLNELKMNVSPDTKVGELDVAQRQTIQIAKALAHDAKILILDEPTASYGRNEKENLMRIVRELAQKGLGIIYISHHLDEVFALADRVTVLRDGKRISCYKKEEINREQIIRDMVGRDAALFFDKEKVDVQDGVLEIKDLYKENYVKKCSFTVKRGEIVGFGGMVGSGRSELMSLIYGSVRADGGQLLKDGKDILSQNPSDAIQKGIALISEDRQKDGMYLGHTVGWNFLSAHMTKNKGLLVGQKRADRDFEKYQNDLHIKTTGARQRISFLSGGNQQKVIISKWLYADGDVYIFDEPTKGIDIGAKEDVYHLMTSLAKEGKFIILVSSDMPELIAMSDRVCVMRNQEIVTELTGTDINEETILSYAIGGK